MLCVYNQYRLRSNLSHFFQLRINDKIFIYLYYCLYKKSGHQFLGKIRLYSRKKTTAFPLLKYLLAHHATKKRSWREEDEERMVNMAGRSASEVWSIERGTCGTKYEYYFDRISHGAISSIHWLARSFWFSFLIIPSLHQLTVSR